MGNVRLSHQITDRTVHGNGIAWWRDRLDNVLAIRPRAENRAQERLLLAQLRFVHTIRVGLPDIELRSSDGFSVEVTNGANDVASLSREPSGQVRAHR